jgi:hypothetical protein
MSVVAGIRRSVAGVVIASAVATTVVGAVNAAPARISSGPLSIPSAAVPGWKSTHLGPGRVGVTVDDPKGVAVAGIELRVLDGGASDMLRRLGTSNAASTQELASALVHGAPQSIYSGWNARVVDVRVDPTSVSGVQASRATARVEFGDLPASRQERIHIVVVGTKPQTYFLSVGQINYPNRLAEAAAAEAGLVAQR